jgi:hypothetical protein
MKRGLQEIQKSCDEITKRVKVLIEKLEEQEEEEHFRNGGVFVVAGYNHIRERLEKVMKCKIKKVQLKWEVEYDFRRSGHQNGEFEVTDIELVDRQEIFDYFGNAPVKLYDEYLDIEPDPKKLSELLDYDDVSSSAEGKVMLEVFRKDPWTKQEMKKFGSSRDTSRDDDYS